MQIKKKKKAGRLCYLFKKKKKRWLSFMKDSSQLCTFSFLIVLSIIETMDMNLSKLWQIVEDRGAWCVLVHGVAKNQTKHSNWTTTVTKYLSPIYQFIYLSSIYHLSIYLCICHLAIALSTYHLPFSLISLPTCTDIIKWDILPHSKPFLINTRSRSSKAEVSTHLRSTRYYHF